MTLIDYIAAAFVMAIGSFVQASVGFGLSLAAAPLLILIDPLFVPAPLLLGATVLTILVSYRDRKGIDTEGLAPLIAGRALGAVPAALLLASLPVDVVRMIMGFVILAGVVMSILGLPLPRGRGTLLIAGTVSGFMGTTAAIGGPPVALAYQRAVGPRLRGTMSAYLTIGSLVSLAALAGVGRFHAAEARLGLVLLPGVVVGFLISRRVALFLDAGYTRAAVLVISAAAGIVVVLTSVL